MKECCPTCGRATAKPKTATIHNTVDLTQVPDAELFKYYKQTAPVEDVRFALRIGVELAPDLEADWQTLLGLAPTLTRSETYRRLRLLQDRWRRAA